MHCSFYSIFCCRSGIVICLLWVASGTILISIINKLMNVADGACRCGCRGRIKNIEYPAPRQGDTLAENFSNFKGIGLYWLPAQLSWRWRVKMGVHCSEQAWKRLQPYVAFLTQLSSQLEQYFGKKWNRKVLTSSRYRIGVFPIITFVFGFRFLGDIMWEYDLWQARMKPFKNIWPFYPNFTNKIKVTHQPTACNRFPPSAWTIRASWNTIFRQLIDCVVFVFTRIVHRSYF